MKKTDEHIENLIALYYSGEAGEDDKRELLAWVEQDPENRQYFFDSGKLWRAMRYGKDAVIEVDREWEVFRRRLERNRAARTRFATLHTMPLRVAAAAAVLLVIVLFSVVLYNNVRSLSFKTATVPASVILSDSSRVYLNAWSTLRYPRRFRGKARKVQLEGEAFFEVAHNESLPFIVKAADARIRVLGTSFNVMAYDTAARVEVVVNTGRVALFPKAYPDKTIVLEPGTKGIFDPDRETVLKTRNTDVNYLAWKTRKLIFENEELETIVRALNNIYHTDIVIGSDPLRACRVTTTFDDLPLDTVLEILRTTLDLRIEKNRNRIILTGEGCE